jgi:hypothetical protein
MPTKIATSSRDKPGCSKIGIPLLEFQVNPPTRDQLANLHPLCNSDDFF